MNKRIWLYWMIPIGFLLLQVAKALIRKLNPAHAYFWGNLAIAGQSLLLLFGLILLLVRLFNRKRSTRSLLISGLLYLTVLVTAGELLFGYWLKEPAKIPRFFLSAFIYYNDHYNTRLLQFQRNGSQYDTGLFYTLKRDAAFAFNNAEFQTRYQTNRAGLRDDSASLEFPEIICLGDSYTMGWGVEQEESFPQQLEKLSGRKVLNAGISSYGTARELLLLRRLKTDSLKYLIIQYCDNDYGENKSFLEHGTQLPVSSKATYDSLVTEQEWTTRYYPGKHFLLTAPLILKKMANLLLPVFDLSQERDREELNPVRAITRFYQVLASALPRQGNYTVIVMYLGNSERVSEGSRSLGNATTAIQAAMQSTGKEIIPFQYGMLNPKKDFFRLDLHMTASGNRKMGEWLHAVIRDRDALRK